MASKTKQTKPKPRSRPAARKQDALATVEAFFARMEAMDMEGALDYVAEDCVYENVPFHKSAGKARIRRDLTLAGKALREFSVEMKNVAVNGATVLTERIDVLTVKGLRVELPVMGAFVVKNGKISEWRDYFDWSLMLGRAAGSVFSAFRARLSRS